MKRVHTKAEMRAAETGYGVALDGKPVQTPGKRELLVPTEALAAAIAGEWNAQQGEIIRNRCR